MTALAHLKPLQHQYGPHTVEFDISNGVMVNATKMAKIFGKRPGDFLKLPSTKRIIALWMQKLDNTDGRKSPFDMPENAPIVLDLADRREISEINPDDYDPRILQARKGGVEGGETWMCRKLAIKFAAWLDVEFEDWLLDTLDSLLFGPLGQSLTLLRQVATLTNQREALRKQVVPDPVQQQVDDLTRQINHLNRRFAATKGQQLTMLRELDQPE